MINIVQEKKDTFPKENEKYVLVYLVFKSADLMNRFARIKIMAGIIINNTSNRLLT
jgi:hypothetical protein